MSTLSAHMIQINLTHFAPDHPSLSALFSYCLTPDHLIAAGKQMLHAGITAYANGDGFS